MTLRLLLLVTILASLQGCFAKGTEANTAKATHAQLQIIADDGILKIDDRNTTYVLADDAIDYRLIASPKGSWLAVETLLFSNLQIIRVYKRDRAGRYKPLQEPVSVKIWAKILKSEAFSTEDIRFPKMRFLEWIDENSMFINLSGETDDKSIDRNITFSLH